MANVKRWIVAAAAAMMLNAGCSSEPEKKTAPANENGADVGELSAFLEKGVDQNRPAGTAAGGPAGQNAGNSASGAQGLPPGHPPINPNATATPAPAPAPASRGDASAPTLQYEVPEGWEAKPGGGMRFAQFDIPASEGATGDAGLIIYYFGPGGAGPIQANLDRWRGMFFDADRQPIGEGGYSTQKLEVAEMPVTLLEIRGHYFDPMTVRDMSEPTKEEYMMFAAVVETPDDGPFFFKATGPAATMESQREAFMKMLRSVRP